MTTTELAALLEWAAPRATIRKIAYPALCPVCQNKVRPHQIQDGSAFYSRICGDSANGYEAYHRACCEAGR